MLSVGGNSRARRDDRGQALILMVFGMTVIFLVAAVVIDVSLWLSERRSVQRAADMAVMAGIQELPGDGGPAETMAVLWAGKNGFENGEGGIVVNPTTLCKNNDPDNPAVSCLAGGVQPVPCSAGCDSLRVVIKKPASLLFASIFGIASFDIEAGASAVCAGCVIGGSAGGAPPPRFVTVPRGLDCSAGGPTVDGRVLDNEGYARIGDLVSATTYIDYGDALAACDGTDYYFALRLNGPTTGGAVANENVYAGCLDPAPPEIVGTEITGLRGNIRDFILYSPSLPIRIGFLLDAGDAGQWAVVLDGATTYSGGINSLAELATGFSVELSGTQPAEAFPVPPFPPSPTLPFQVVANNVRQINDSYCVALSDPNYHSTFGTGWDQTGERRHNLKVLLASDRARFQLSCDGAPVHDFNQDYLRQSGPEWVSDTNGLEGSIIAGRRGPDRSASSIVWNLEHTDLTGWGDEPGENAVGQSPPFDPSYPTFDAQYDAFVWEVIYEFRIPMDDYATCDAMTFGLEHFLRATGPVGGMHNSPAKTADAGTLVVVPMRAMLVE